MFQREEAQLTQLFQNALGDLDLIIPSAIPWVPTPFSGKWGMGTATCFQIAAAEAREGNQLHVPTRAQEIAELVVGQITPPEGILEIRSEGAYVNAYFDPASYASRVVETILDQAANFGRGQPQSERVMVEYAQPNTHHSFHIGHARNVILGEALARLVEFAGYETIRASYPGDLGLSVITCLWAYDRFHRGKEPAGIHERGQWLTRIYAEANDLLSIDEESSEEIQANQRQYEAERRELYQRWLQGEQEIRELWKITRQWSLDELDEILNILGVRMDVFFFESEMEGPAQAIVRELIELRIADDERPEGPVLVRIDDKLGLKKEKYRTAIILRSDGSTLYLTKDLALAKEKFERYKVDRSVYVVDVRQSLHFQQAFKILELWGFPQAAKCFHLPYGFVTLPEGAMSSRKGQVVFFMDVLEEAEERALKVIADKNPDLAEESRQEVARQVGLGALIYSMLSVDNNREVLFEWDAALSFDGQSAPYIQNAHVRANSILRKAGDFPDDAHFSHDLAEMEVELIEKLSQFPGLVQRAAAEYKPLLMATYVYELAKTFHAFYHTVPVIQSEPTGTRNARLQLTAATKQVLANSLRLLGIQAPLVM